MIPEVNPYNNYRGDGVATKFDFDFEIKDGSQLVVEKIDENDVAVRLVENVDYEIVLIDDEIAGFINFPIEDSAYGVLQNNEILSLQLDLPFRQDSEYGQSSLLDLNSIEFSLDYLTRLCQILKRQLERSIKVKEGSDSTPDALLKSINSGVVVAQESAKNAKDSELIASEKAELATEQYEKIEQGQIVYLGDTAPTDDKYTVWISPEDNKVDLELQQIKEMLEKQTGAFAGQTIFSLDPLFEDTLHLADGTLLLVGGIYDQFIADYISKLYTTNSERFCTEDEWQESVLKYGVCGKYVYNEGVSVRLPKLGNYLYSNIANTAPVVGNGMTLGLYNDSGNYGLTQGGSYANTISMCVDAYGKPVSTSTNNNPAQNRNSLGVTTDSEKSGIIADLSGLKVIEGYYYIVVGGGTKTDIEVNLDNIATDLSNKVDIDLANCTRPYVIETYQNGASWYRIWSDGWCEQGGRTGEINNVSTATINLLQPYKDGNYQVQMTGCLGGATMRSIIGTVQEFNTDSFVMYYTNTQDSKTGVLQWEAKGYIA